MKHCAPSQRPDRRALRLAGHFHGGSTDPSPTADFDDKARSRHVLESEKMDPDAAVMIGDPALSDPHGARGRQLDSFDRRSSGARAPTQELVEAGAGSLVCPRRPSLATLLVGGFPPGARGATTATHSGPPNSRFHRLRFCSMVGGRDRPLQPARRWVASGARESKYQNVGSGFELAVCEGLCAPRSNPRRPRWTASAARPASTFARILAIQGGA